MTLSQFAALDRAQWTIHEIASSLGPDRCREVALEMRAFSEQFPLDVRVDAANRLLLEAMKYEAIRDGQAWRR